MNILIKKRSLIVLLLITVAGIITALVFGACMFDEMCDAGWVYEINYYSWDPGIERHREKWILEHINDGFRYGVVACFALVVALISCVTALLKVSLSKQVSDSKID